MTLADRIRSRCRVDGDCLIWRGCVNNHGTPAGHNRELGNYQPHRILWIESGRPLKRNGVFTHPVCDNDLCIAPKHQVHLTRKEAAKMWQMNGSVAHKLRTTEANRKLPHVKMTMEKARAIRQRYAEIQNAAQVAREFDIRHDHAHKICRNKTWQEVSPWAI